MVKILHRDTQQNLFQHITAIEPIRNITQDSNHLFWLDLADPTEAELAQIGEMFDLHPLALEDASMEHQRPKIEAYDDFLFVVFYTVHLETVMHNLMISELDIFVGRNYLITVHRNRIAELDEAQQRWSRSGKQHEWDTGELLYTLLDTLVDAYFPVGDALVEAAEQLEDRIFMGEGRGSQITMELLELKKRFLEFRRITMSERDLLNILTNRDNPLFGKQVSVYFRDIHDHVSRLTDTLDLYRDQLSTAMDANLSITSNELNKVMRTLTATSIILMFNSLIAGIYGMNFDIMPETKWQYGYFGVLSAMIVASLALMLFFKRLKWL